jgi:pyruvate dehydrogenase E1 component alpha subunit
MGSTAIVAGTVPVGVGLGYSIKIKRTDQVSVIFIGDAVAEAGVFFESVNLAVLKHLPVLFVCENNLYSVYSPLSVRQPEGREIHRMVAGLGLPATSGDGNDAVGCYRMASDAVRDIRTGSGPRLLEFSTYRWREHCGPFYDNDIGYRSVAEFEHWKALDPIDRLRRELLETQAVSSAEIEAMEREIAREVEAAFRFAEDSPFPSADAASAHVYSTAAQ